MGLRVAKGGRRVNSAPSPMLNTALSSPFPLELLVRAEKRAGFKFEHLRHEQVRAGIKTQSRWIALPGDRAEGPSLIAVPGIGFRLYVERILTLTLKMRCVGDTIEARGPFSFRDAESTMVRIQRLWYEPDVRLLTEAEVEKEGYKHSGLEGFLRTWCDMNACWFGYRDHSVYIYEGWGVEYEYIK